MVGMEAGPQRFVGTDARTRLKDGLARALDTGSHIIVAGPSGHGKSRLLDDIPDLLAGTVRQDLDLEAADTSRPWACIAKHARNFAARRARSKYRAFVLDAIDALVASDRKCFSDLRTLLKDVSSSMCVVMSSDREFAGKVGRFRPNVARIDVYPVPARDLIAYGKTAASDVAHSTIVSIAHACEGSFPMFWRRLRCLYEFSPMGLQYLPDIEDARPLTAKEAVIHVLGGRPSMDEVESCIQAFGSHMFVDTLAHNAPLVCESLSSFSDRIRQHVLCLPAGLAINAVDKSARDSVLLIRAMAWIGTLREGSKVDRKRGVKVRVEDLEFTNTLAKSNARAGARKRVNSTIDPGCTVAELVWARSSAASASPGSPEEDQGEPEKSHHCERRY